MNGTTTPKPRKTRRNAQMADYKAVIARKERDPELSTAAAIRLVAKSRRKSRASVQASYYSVRKAEAQQDIKSQPIAPTVRKPGKKNGAVPTGTLVRHALEAMDRLEAENASLRQQNEALRNRIAQIKNCL